MDVISCYDQCTTVLESAVHDMLFNKNQHLFDTQYENLTRFVNLSQTIRYQVVFDKSNPLKGYFYSLAALVFLMRYVESAAFAKETKFEFQPAQIWVTCHMLANKAFEDHAFTLLAWEKMSGLPLAKAELHVLQVINYDITLTSNDINQICDLLFMKLF